MIYRIEIPWSERDKYRKLSVQEYDFLKSVVVGLPEDNEGFYPPNGLMVDDEGLEALLKISSLELKNFKNNYMPDRELGVVKKVSDIGQVTHVHIPNLGLLLINEVIAIEDACTEALQNKLNEGWRIIAVCPPNSARRPDYILGRTKA